MTGRTPSRSKHGERFFLVMGLVLFAIVVTGLAPHWASLLGPGLFVAALAAKLVVARTAARASSVDAVFA